MKKNITKIIFITLILLIGFILGLRNDFVFAETRLGLEQNIKNKNKELYNLTKEADRIRIEISKTSGEKASLKKELRLINQEQKSLENNISQTRNKIDILGSEIDKTEQDINKQNSTIIEQSKFLESILRRINQQETLSIFESFLSSRSLSFFLQKRDQYLNLQNPILEKTKKLREHKIILSKDKGKLEDKQGTLKIEKEKLNDQKNIVISQSEKKKKVLIQTKNKESIYQKNLKNTLAVIKGLNKEIRNFESKLKFILNKKSLPEKGSGILGWPLHHILITQRFGKTTSSGRLYLSGSHSGMDFRAAVGTPVYAVADGIVKGAGNTDEACPRTSFGKWVFIEHSDIGLSTTYGHLSRFKVTNGQRVKKGDIIAYSGNTGHSTAPHLHVTVYATKGINGEQGVRVTNRKSNSCAGKSYYMPLAPTAAYLDPIDYMPKTTLSNFKNPSLSGR